MVVAEQYADLHEYAMSLGVDLDREDEEHLLPTVQEAFNSSLPRSWSEYMHESGRVYYVKEGSSTTTWVHPMDQVYQDLFDVIHRVRNDRPDATQAEREAVLFEHLQMIHQRALTELQGWSGPYMSEQGEYYYNDNFQVSS